MEKMLKIIFLLLYIFSSPSFADNLVLSTKLKLEYPTPKLIAHDETYLFVKYNDWTFSHEIINPKTFYPNIDLTDFERDFIKSIFDKNERSKLPEWLRVLSEELSELSGVNSNKFERFKVGLAEVISIYNKKNKKGQIYIFEDLVLHQISTIGTKDNHVLIERSIKER